MIDGRARSCEDLRVSSSLLSIIAARHSKRVFLDREPLRSDVEAVLRAAASAPSAKNTQPWDVVAARGEPLRKLAASLCANYDENKQESADFPYYPDPLPAAFAERARETALAIFEHKGIDPSDSAAKRAHSRGNYEFFGAPLVLFFLLPAGAARGTFLDLGFYLQNVMLGFEAIGASSCPLASILAMTRSIRDSLRLPDDRWLCCALAVGYADPAARVNSFFPPRRPLEDVLTWKE